MHRRPTLALLASAALLALAGCSLEKVDHGLEGAAASASLVADPEAGHELHRMFDAEKRNAVVGELPAQF
jgi:hypothetical protein